MPSHVNLNGQLVEIDEALRELDRWDCEESLAHFLKTFWKHIDPAEFKDGWVIDAICEHLQAIVDGEIRHTIFNLPPRTLKSSLISVAFPAWVWAQRHRSHTSGPGVKFLFASYADRLSKRDSIRCRRVIESPLYQHFWGEWFRMTTDQNTSARFTNSVGGERLITSISTSATGDGGDCFVAGTLVSTPIGAKRIEDIVAGDPVFSYDHQREKVVISRVVATREIAANDFCEIRTVSGHSIKCTEDHRIYSPGRGYISASRLGIGDRLLVNRAVKVPCGQAGVPPDLRQLREGHDQAAFRGPKGSQAGQSGRLLQQRLLARASCGEEFNGPLQAMRQAFERSTRALLRRAMQTSVHRREGACALAQGMLAVWRRIFRQDQILLAGVCGSSPLDADGWREEFPLFNQRQIREFASPDGRADTRARWPQMRGLLSGGQADEALPWAHQNNSSGASHRRECPSQSAAQSDHAMRELPSEAPSGFFSEIATIERYRSETVSVYDIQVEIQSNFFANGILAHNCIVVDDPNPAEDVESEASIESTLEWWHGTMPTRLNDQDKSVYIVVQQRVAENDLTGDILQTDAEKWTHVMIPMRYDPERSFVTSIGWKDPREVEGELMWPERFSAAAIEDLAKRLGPWRAAGQLEQSPTPKGGGIIKREWWQPWEGEFPPFSYILATLDTAYTEKQENDPSGMAVWGVFNHDVVAQYPRNVLGPTDRNYTLQSPRVMLIDAWNERLDLHSLVTKVARTCKLRKVDKLRIENKASGISVAQEMRRLFGNEDWAVELFDPKSQDKMARLYSVQHIFAEHMVYAPDREYAETVISQCEVFPKGRHDEQVDNTSSALKHLRDMGLLQRPPEVQQDIEDEMRHDMQRTPTPLYPG